MSTILVIVIHSTCELYLQPYLNSKAKAQICKDASFRADRSVFVFFMCRDFFSVSHSELHGHSHQQLQALHWVNKHISQILKPK